MKPGLNLVTVEYADILSSMHIAELTRHEDALKRCFQNDVKLLWDIKRCQDGTIKLQLLKHGIVDVELVEIEEDKLPFIQSATLVEEVLSYDRDKEFREIQSYLEGRVSEWISRLNSLYEKVKSWSPSGSRPIEGSQLQRSEELLRNYKVDLREVPTLAILSGNKRVSFVPAGIWTIGADGRVNVTTNNSQFMLVDLRRDRNSDSNWRLVNPAQRVNNIQFDKTSYLRLLEE